AQHPKDARGHYTLGRLHSLAFARSEQEAQVILKDLQTQKPLPLPQFPPFESILESPDRLAERKADACKHLVESVRQYQRATDLARREALYWLGLGWMLEQGAACADEVGLPLLAPSRKVAAIEWRDRALLPYRQAYALTVRADLKKQSLGPE